MKHSFYFYTTFSLLIILGLIISGYIFGWTVPSANPPSGNLSAPINTGSTNQAKTGYLAVGTSTTPTYPLEVGNQLRVWGQLISQVTSGTAPFVISSPTKVTNLNADYLDGYNAADLLASGGGGGAISISSNFTPCTMVGSTSYYTYADICSGYGPERFIWSETGLSDTDSDGCLESANIPGLCLVRGTNAWIEPMYNQSVIVDLSASPSSTCGNTVNVILTWSTINATSCTASGGWSGTKATSGSETINNVTQTTSFTLYCTGPNKQPGQKTVQVIVSGSCREIVIYQSGSYGAGPQTRNAADSRCDLASSLGCTVNRALISISSIDEIQDMPTNYGVPTNLPVYAINRTGTTKAKIGNNWADILDGSILATLDTAWASGGSLYWTYSTYTGALSSYYCSGGYNGSAGRANYTDNHFIGSGYYSCSTNLYIACLCVR